MMMISANGKWVPCQINHQFPERYSKSQFDDNYVLENSFLLEVYEVLITGYFRNASYFSGIIKV